MWYLHCVIGTLYVCYLRIRSRRIAYFRVQRYFEVILSSMSYVLVRDTAKHCAVNVRILREYERKRCFTRTDGSILPSIEWPI